MKYLLSIIVVGLLLSWVAIYFHPLLALGVGSLYAKVLTVLAIAGGLIGWQLINISFNLDGRDCDHKKINTHHENLFTVHEYRRLHEVDYAEFAQAVKRRVDERRII